MNTKARDGARRTIIDGWDFTHPLTAGDVAEMFKVNNKTVIRWANAGILVSFKTLGGHRRFSAEQVTALITRSEQPRAGSDGHDESE